MSEDVSEWRGLPCWCCVAYRAEAEVERLTDALADRDRRIAVALEPHVVREWPGTKICASYVKVLRGES